MHGGCPSEFFVTPGYGERLLQDLHYAQAVRIGPGLETSGQGGWDDGLRISAADLLNATFEALAAEIRLHPSDRAGRGSPACDRAILPNISTCA